MRVKRLELKSFRNIANMILSPCEGVNVIYGDNAQGKTNLIETLWLFTGARSFRGAKEAEMIAFGKERAVLSADFFSQGRNQSAEMILGAGKRVKLNDIELAGQSELAGNYNAVVFSPLHLSLVQDGPALRRRFLDTLLCQLRPSCIKLIQAYNRIISQRNSLLRDLFRHPDLLDTLEIWDIKLSQYAAAILKARISLLDELAVSASAAYDGISSFREAMSVGYICTLETDVRDVGESELAGLMTERLQKGRAQDMQTGTTGIGPHRDDIDIQVGEKSARLYGSQGQQRSCVLALKLAECEVLRRLTGETPVVLLDDVLSELDEGRRDYLLNHLGMGQVFITCCDTQDMRPLAGERFRIEKGKIV